MILLHVAPSEKPTFTSPIMNKSLKRMKSKYDSMKKERDMHPSLLWLETLIIYRWSYLTFFCGCTYWVFSKNLFILQILVEISWSSVYKVGLFQHLVKFVKVMQVLDNSPSLMDVPLFQTIVITSLNDDINPKECESHKYWW
jgi:hypothetical protein